jgi:hypothetical protein
MQWTSLLPLLPLLPLTPAHPYFSQSNHAKVHSCSRCNTTLPSTLPTVKFLQLMASCHSSKYGAKILICLNCSTLCCPRNPAKMQNPYQLVRKDRSTSVGYTAPAIPCQKAECLHCSIIILRPMPRCKTLTYTFISLLHHHAKMQMCLKCSTVPLGPNAKMQALTDALKELIHYQPRCE